jgi:hypothetical protein
MNKLAVYNYEGGLSGRPTAYQSLGKFDYANRFFTSQWETRRFVGGAALFQMRFRLPPTAQEHLLYPRAFDRLLGEVDELDFGELSRAVESG